MLTIYQTDALPRNFVAENTDGQRFLIPAIPSAADAWRKRTPYKGNYKLTRSPEYIQNMYASADAEEPDAGDTARTESLRIRLSPAEKARLQRQADDAGASVSAHIRAVCQL